jgi:hypothetical protein
LIQAWSRGCNIPPTPFYNRFWFYPSAEEKAGCNFRGFPAGGAPSGGDPFDLGKGEGVWTKDFWVFFVGPRASYLGHCGGDFSVVLFTGAWHELERRRVHCRLRIQSSGGSDLHHSA